MKFSIVNRMAKVTSVLIAGAMLLCGCDGTANIGGSTDILSKLSANPEKYIELGNYKGLDVKKGFHEVTEEEIEDEIKTLVDSMTTYDEVADAIVETGDIANIDYVGKLDGVAFDGGTAQGYDLTIGSNRFISGFEDGLVGVKSGETVDLNLTFPENYGNEELSGKDVIFTVTVNSVSRANVPTFNDEFIKEVSQGEYTNIADFKAALKDEIALEYEEQYELKYYEDLWNAAVDNATIIKDIPDELISENSSRILLNAQQYAASYQMQFSDFVSNYMGMTTDDFYAQSAEYAKTASKENLVMWAIAKAEGITVSQEEIDEALEEYVRLGSYASLEEAKASSDYKYMHDYILLSKVQDFIAAQAVK